MATLTTGQQALLRFLQKQSVLTAEEAVAVEALCRDEGINIAEALERRNVMTDRQLAELLAPALRLRLVDLASHTIDPVVTRLVKETLVTKYEIIPLRLEGNTLDVATVNPLDLEALKALEFATGKRVHFVVACRTEIHEAIKHTYRKIRLYTATLTVSDGEGCPGFIFTGQTATCNGSSQVSVTRVVAPVRLGRVDRNEKNGTATVKVRVPGRGVLKLNGAGVVTQRSAARASSLALQVAGRRTVRLRVEAKGRAKRRLNRTGKVKVRARVSFKARGADPNTQTKRVKLVKRRG